MRLGGYEVSGGLTKGRGDAGSSVRRLHPEKGKRPAGRGCSLLSSSRSSSPIRETLAVSCTSVLPNEKLAATYSSVLLDATDDGNIGDNAREAYAYLTEERGLDRKTLRAYGVGCATYRFPSSSGRCAHVAVIWML